MCVCCLLIITADGMLLKLPASSYIIHVLCGQCQKITGVGYFNELPAGRCDFTCIAWLRGSV